MRSVRATAAVPPACQLSPLSSLSTSKATACDIVTVQLCSANQQAVLQAGGSRMLREEVTENDIADIIARWTGIPVSKLVSSERERLLGLADELHKRVIGQNEAVEAVADAVQRCVCCKLLKESKLACMHSRGGLAVQALAGPG